MANVTKIKRGQNKPTVNNLQEWQLGFDITNDDLYIKDQIKDEIIYIGGNSISGIVENTKTISEETVLRIDVISGVVEENITKIEQVSGTVHQEITRLDTRIDSLVIPKLFIVDTEADLPLNDIHEGDKAVVKNVNKEETWFYEYGIDPQDGVTKWLQIHRIETIVTSVTGDNIWTELDSSTLTLTNSTKDKIDTSFVEASLVNGNTINFKQANNAIYDLSLQDLVIDDGTWN